MLQGNKVLARLATPTKNSYRDAIAKIIGDIQSENGLNDPDLADRLGCSAPTIANARNKRTNLDGVTLARIEHQFGPAALDPFLALGGSRAIPIAAVCNTDGDYALVLSAALHFVIEAQRPTSDGGIEVTPNEVRPNLALLKDARTAIDALIAMGEAPAVSEVRSAVR